MKNKNEYKYLNFLFFISFKKLYLRSSSMGCHSLTYQENPPVLRVLHRKSEQNEKSSAGVYRYGFNGIEKDDELFEGALSFKYRVHDVRLARFLSVDPLFRKYSYNSPYAFCENRVVDGIDIEGLEHESYLVYLNKQGAVIKKVELYKTDVGAKGWGVKHKIMDENGNVVEEKFTATDPPAIWTGKYRPLYINGIKIFGDSYDLEGEDGFYNGGWQTMLGSAGLVFSGLGIAMKGPSIMRLVGLGLSLDDAMKGGNDKTVLEQIIGDNDALQGVLKFTKLTMSFVSKYKKAQDILEKGGDVAEYMDFIIKEFKSVKKFKETMEYAKKEIEGKMKELEELQDKKSSTNTTDVKKTTSDSKSKKSSVKSESKKKKG